MNRRKNLLCVFFLVLTVLSCVLAVPALAASSGPAAGGTSSVAAGGKTGGTASSKAGGTAESAPAQQTGGRQRVSSAPAATASSRRYTSASRAASSRRVRRRASAAAASSVPASSEEPSDVFSGESAEAESVISLPGVDSVDENNPFSSAMTNPEQTRKMNVQGLLAWACIGLGVVVVLVVVLSNRRPPRGPGRKRYRRQKRGSGKHLLNDRYYRNLNRY